MSRAPRDRGDLPETIAVEWPGGPYNFELAPVQFAEPLRPAEHRPGWFYVTGQVVKPEDVATTGVVRTLYAEKVGDGRFRMIPKEPWTTVNPLAFREPPRLPWG